MHAFGFFHEQSRTDRDTYVRIALENVKDGKENNFKSYTASQITALGEPYDYRESLSKFIVMLDWHEFNMIQFKDCVGHNLIVRLVSSYSLTVSSSFAYQETLYTSSSPVSFHAPSFRPFFFVQSISSNPIRLG